MGRIEELREKLRVSDAGGRLPDTGSPRYISTPQPPQTTDSKRRETIKSKRLGPSTLFRALADVDFSALDPLDFEKLCLAMFENFGFTGRLTALTGDNGIDILLHDCEDNRFCVQCKRYAKGQNVSPREVREFAGSLDYARASAGYFITTGSFSSQCFTFIRKLSRPMYLVDGEAVKELLIGSEELYRTTSSFPDLAPAAAVRMCLFRAASPTDAGSNMEIKETTGIDVVRIENLPTFEK